MAFANSFAALARASATPPVRCTSLTRRAALRTFGAALTTRAFTVRAAADTLTVTDKTVGAGKEVREGAVVKVHYTLTLGGFEGEAGSKVVDSSRSRGRPFSYNFAAGQVIKGWDQGVAGMKVGGRRTLVIPPALGYGERGAGGVIPPGATLYFDIELLDVV